MTAAVTGLHTCTGSEETTGVTTITGEGLILNFCGPVRGWGVLTPGIFCCRAPTLLITNCVNTPPGEGRAAANKNLQVKNLQFSYFILLVIVFINIYCAPLGQFLTGTTYLHGMCQFPPKEMTHFSQPKPNLYNNMKGIQTGCSY